ncbi:hypothetical protein Sste5346_000702 [Sporothrix stenoceras]|uniref:Uncharacterized protein n=1 Tax=Sporothrix stenoceras TaxID=5173 RepID=A0ABR3ZQ45_9PEZI
MSSPSPASTASQKHHQQKQSPLYKAVMTPVIFVSFLVSLAWVEFRYSMLRSHEHGNSPQNPNKSNKSAQPQNGNNTATNADAACSQHRMPMPAWLHSLVYRRQPYHYVLVKGADGQPADTDRSYTTAKTTKASNKNDGSYYHSMQRKLLKMESDEAFRIRTTVLWVMGFAAAGSAWLTASFVRWIVGYLWR